MHIINTHVIMYMQIILQCSVRKPNIMRVAPAPLYNTFTDVLTFYKALEKILTSATE